MTEAVDQREQEKEQLSLTIRVLTKVWDDHSEYTRFC